MLLDWTQKEDKKIRLSPESNPDSGLSRMVAIFGKMGHEQVLQPCR